MEERKDQKQETKETSWITSFIYKPVMSWVMNIVVTLVGIVCFMQLSITEYPAIASQRLSLETYYSDAGAEVVETQITRPLEEALMGTTGLKSISSQSTTGASRIYLEFHSWANMNETYTQVQNKVSKARGYIDGGGRVKIRDTQISKNDANAYPTLFLMLYGKEYNSIELADAATRYVKAELETLPGVAIVTVHGGGAAGASPYAMDIKISPEKLNSFKLSPNDVINALRQQVFKQPFGMITDGVYERSMVIRAELNTVDAFGSNIFITADPYSYEKSYIKLMDAVDSIKIRTEDPNTKSLYTTLGADNKFKSFEAVGISVVAQPRESPIKVSKAFYKKFNDLKKTVPQGMKLDLVYDQAIQIEASINSVYRALAEAIVFVFLVILFFLQSARATFIPMVTIPICLLGGFAVMYFFSFTINLLTLLAMVLATGLVVDDAIVVLENIYKYIEKGLKPFEAAKKGTSEIQFSIIAMTLTLAAVYAPIALTTGLVGSVFFEFAFTLTGTVLLSGAVALILSPMMCARILSKHEEKDTSDNSLASNAKTKITHWLNTLDEVYEKTLTKAIHYKGLIFTSAVSLIIASGLLLKFALPSILSPEVDGGTFIIRPIVPNGIKLENLEKSMSKLYKLVQEIPYLDKYSTYIDTKGGMTQIYGYLKKGKRPSCNQIMQKQAAIFNKNSPSSLSNAVPVCLSSNISGDQGSDDFVISVQSNKDYNELVRLSNRITSSLSTQEGIRSDSIRFDNTAKIPSYLILPNRKKIAELGVNIDNLADLTNLSTGIIASYFERDNRRADVVVKTPDNITPEQILNFGLKVRDSKGSYVVPLKEIVTLQKTFQRPAIPHQSGMRSFTIMAKTEGNYGLDTVYSNFKDMADRTLPNGYKIEPLGSLKEYIEESNNIYFIIGLSLLFIYLIMCAQFESFVDPLIIMGTVPMSWVGAIILLSLSSEGSLNIFSWIGLLTLVGLITKHGILIVDFANKNIASGKNIRDSIISASATRLRPILMTTAAMVLGAVPLSLATGIGSEIRRQIGIVIVGGMTLGTIFTLFLVPCLYIIVKNLTYRKRV